jgi:hypothetical protein
MARDAVTITALAPGVSSDNPAGTAINTTNGANIAAAGQSGRLLVRVTNTSGASKNVTFQKGNTNVPASPPALRAGLGHLVVAVPATTGDVLVVLETARHLRSDGSINIDFQAGHTGVVSAVQLPKGA